MDKLKPCKCKSNAVELRMGYDKGEPAWAFVECLECGKHTVIYYKNDMTLQELHNKIIYKWNRRA